jgi:hypothetical protein
MLNQVVKKVGYFKNGCLHGKGTLEQYNVIEGAEDDRKMFSRDEGIFENGSLKVKQNINF